MRIRMLAMILLAGTASVAAAQSRDEERRAERRIERLEDEMRAVQRKVFPSGRPDLQPEIQAQRAVPGAGGIPASSAVADLTARLDAMEAQLARLTGQTEENGFRLRRMEDALSRAEARIAELQQPPAPAPVEEPAPAETVSPQPAAAAAPGPDAAGAAGDAGEDAYLAGFRLWEQGRFADAQKALEAMAKKYPKHRRASYARNLAGRALLDDGKPAAAAKLLLANYQTDPKGERAPDSLYYLGQALTRLDRLQEACQVYEELQDVYGASMSGFLKQSLPKARSAAKCG